MLVSKCPTAHGILDANFGIAHRYASLGGPKQGEVKIFK
jgi:hypothetical protein